MSKTLTETDYDLWNPKASHIKQENTFSSYSNFSTNRSGSYKRTQKKNENLSPNVKDERSARLTGGAVASSSFPFPPMNCSPSNCREFFSSPSSTPEVHSGAFSSEGTHYASAEKEPLSLQSHPSLDSVVASPLGTSAPEEASNLWRTANNPPSKESRVEYAFVASDRHLVPKPSSLCWPSLSQLEVTYHKPPFGNYFPVPSFSQEPFRAFNQEKLLLQKSVEPCAATTATTAITPPSVYFQNVPSDNRFFSLCRDTSSLVIYPSPISDIQGKRTYSDHNLMTNYSQSDNKNNHSLHLPQQGDNRLEKSEEDWNASSPPVLPLFLPYYREHSSLNSMHHRNACPYNANTGNLNNTPNRPYGNETKVSDAYRNSCAHAEWVGAPGIPSSLHGRGNALITNDPESSNFTSSVDDNKSKVNLFVSNLSPHETDASLRDAFSDFGEVISTTVMRNINTTESKGSGFVCFRSHESAQQAMNFFNLPFADDAQSRAFSEKATGSVDNGITTASFSISCATNFTYPICGDCPPPYKGKIPPVQVVQCQTNANADTSQQADILNVAGKECGPVENISHTPPPPTSFQNQFQPEEKELESVLHFLPSQEKETNESTSEGNEPLPLTDACNTVPIEPLEPSSPNEERFESPLDAHKIPNLKALQLRNRAHTLKVDWANRRHEKHLSIKCPHKVKKLFVRNIPMSTKEGEIRELFSQFGTLKEVTLHIETDKGTSGRNSSNWGEKSDTLGSISAPKPPTFRPFPLSYYAFVVYEEEGVAMHAVRCIHNSKPFPTCGSVSLLVKAADDEPQHFSTAVPSAMVQPPKNVVHLDAAVEKDGGSGQFAPYHFLNKVEGVKRREFL